MKAQYEQAARKFSAMPAKTEVAFWQLMAEKDICGAMELLAGQGFSICESSAWIVSLEGLT